mgnify:CR=1 FL=1
MFGRKKRMIESLKRELLSEMKAREREYQRAEQLSAELKEVREKLEKLEGKKAFIDQFYNLLTFDGHRQEGCND